MHYFQFDWNMLLTVSSGSSTSSSSYLWSRATEGEKNDGGSSLSNLGKGKWVGTMMGATDTPSGIKLLGKQSHK